mgnify:CR=1 FL=1|tara:strand:- start:1430 stop:1783 length:354 start_codon:yes stop_codon:yes gene_type:complete
MKTIYEYIDKRDLKKANTKIQKILIKILNTARGGIGGGTITSRSGDLKNTTKSFLILSKDSLKLNIQTVDYYKFLDTGTKKIKKPWFFTDELTSNKQFKEIVADLIRQATVKKILNK